MTILKRTLRRVGEIRERAFQLFEIDLINAID